MLFDTHCHPYLAKEKSQDEILENFFNGGGMYLNSIGVDLESSESSIELSKKIPGVFASIGIHPAHSLEYNGKLEETLGKLEEIYEKHRENIVAIGETGLDYYWLDSLSEKYSLSKNEIIALQKDFFRGQIGLARKLGFPIIIHNRNAASDVFDILSSENFKNFVFHCYSEDLEYAEKLLAFAPNCKLGFGGVATFKNTQSVKGTVKNVPLKNIIIETDSPYLTPSPYRGKQENEPLFCKYVLSEIIDLRKESSEEIEEQIFKNSYDFFGINN